MNQNGAILWLTGLSGAGKTTIAQRLENNLREQGYLVELLDGDVIRQNLSQGLSFSKEDRDINVRRVGYVANLLSRNGVIVIVSLISPYRAVRDELRVSTNNFVEIYVNAPIEICEVRDVKGLYAKARNGEIKSFTGIDDPYEEPLNPHITCYTANETIHQSIYKILNWLEKANQLPELVIPNTSKKELNLTSERV
jgi:adenylylsulfate kinase